jgi:hypothetical protein
MGFIKEPEGIDFVIQGKPLTEQQKQAISAFIQADKAAMALRPTSRKSQPQDGRKRHEKQSV